MIDPNIWFYTLSTIAQTLAAMLALGATFTIFKLNIINKRLSDLKDRLFLVVASFENDLTKCPENMEEDELIKKTDECLDKFSNTENLTKERLRKIYKNMTGAEVIFTNDKDLILFLKNNLDRFRTDRSKKNETLKFLKKSLFLLSMPIILSIYLLPLHSFFKLYDGEILLVIITLAIFSIYFQGRIIWKISYN
ncbi:MAG: hypothetical protein ABIG90_03805 [bacterium]